MACLHGGTLLRGGGVTLVTGTNLRVITGSEGSQEAKRRFRMAPFIEKARAGVTGKKADLRSGPVCVFGRGTGDIFRVTERVFAVLVAAFVCKLQIHESINLISKLFLLKFY